MRVSTKQISAPSRNINSASLHPNISQTYLINVRPRIKMEFPSPVKTYHRDTYPAIDPTSPRLSTAGKNIVITGGGAGIGVGLAHSFAQSGASTISLLGRTEKTLIDTKTQLEKEYTKTKIYTYVADIVNKSALVTAFESIKAAVGPIDVLVANAGFLPNLNPIAKVDLEDWYNGFEVNVKGNFNVVTAFVPVAAEGAAIINISTGVTHLKYLPGYSGYHTSKLAAAKFFEYVHHEYPEFFVLNIHPGVIMTASKFSLSTQSSYVCSIRSFVKSY